MRVKKSLEKNLKNKFGELKRITYLCTRFEKQKFCKRGRAERIKQTNDL
jgi:hypothetical protein